ncbi:hypothetical protein D3C87_1786030 [compost metagenome]
MALLVLLRSIGFGFGLSHIDKPRMAEYSQPYVVKVVFVFFIVWSVQLNLCIEKLTIDSELSPKL